MLALRLSTRLLTLGLFTLLFTSLFTIGCGDDDAMSMPDGGDPNSVNVPIGPAGGQAALASGASVTIPPGALSEQVTIGVSEVDNLPPLPTSHVRSGTALAFTPHGTAFSIPVTLRVPFTSNASQIARLDDADDTSWEILDIGTFAGGFVTFEVDGFSIYLPVRRTSGMIMIDGGSGNSGTGGTGGNAGIGGTGGTQPIDGGAGTGGTIDGTDAGVETDASVIADAGVVIDAGPSCVLDLCGQDCVDTFSDVQHCGACNSACSAGQLCSDSACYCPIENQCQEATLDVDGGVSVDAGVGTSFCADLQNDRNHCGACDGVCVTGQTCVLGSCATIVCGAGESLCGNDCIDPQTDLDHCGGCSSGGSSETLFCQINDDHCAGYCSEVGGTGCLSAFANYWECLDPMTNRRHCGACDNACANDERCFDGACEPVNCVAGEIACDGVCISGDSCGETCGMNATCDLGGCICANGTTECVGQHGSECVDLDSDDNNCGACGTMCTGGESCVGGVCDCAGTNPASCEGYCTDLDSDVNNCGACYNLCYGDEQCVAGDCVLPACQAGQTRCGTVCVDVSTDESNCGGCVPPSAPVVDTCYAGESCFCGDFALTECSIGGGLAVCTDTTMDRDHCGQCGNPCATGEDCVSGACQAIDCGTKTLCGNTCVDSPSCGIACDVGKGELCGSGACYPGV